MTTPNLPCDAYGVPSTANVDDVIANVRAAWSVGPYTDLSRETVLSWAIALADDVEALRKAQGDADAMRNEALRRVTSLLRGCSRDWMRKHGLDMGGSGLKLVNGEYGGEGVAVPIDPEHRGTR